MWACAGCGYNSCDRCCRRLSREHPVRPCPQGHALVCVVTKSQVHHGPAICNNCKHEVGWPNSPPFFHCTECQYNRCRECAASSLEIRRGQSLDVDSEIQVRVLSSYPMTITAAEEQPQERLGHSKLRSLGAQHRTLQESLQKQQAQLEQQSAELERMRQRWTSLLEQEEAAEPFAPLPRHRMRSNRRGLSKGRHRSREGSRSASGEAMRRASREFSPDAFMA